MLTLKNELNEPFCFVKLIANSKVISVEWNEYINLPQVQESAAKIQELVNENHVVDLLSNFSKCKKFDQEVTEYFNNTFYPELSAIGISHHAIIFSEEAFKRIMKKTFCKFYSVFFEIEVFNNPDLALNWLQKKYVKSAS